MKTVTLTLITEPKELPAGKVFAGFKFSLVSVGGDASSETVTTETVVDFTDVPPGTYTASVAAIDDAGAPIGDVISIEVSVVEPATFPAPASLSASVA